MVLLMAVLACGIVGGASTALLAAVSGSREPVAPRLDRRRVRSFLHRHEHLAAVLHRRLDAQQATGLVLLAALTILAATVSVVGVLFVLATSDPVFGRTDGPLAQWAADNADPDAVTAIRQISRLGGASGVILAAIAVALAEVRRSRGGAVLVFLGLVIGGQYAIVNLAKLVINRARPEVLQLSDPFNASFPSGHAAAAASAYAAFALLLGRRRSRALQVLLAGVAGGVAFAVAATRVALGVHWFTDVVAGLIVGWGWFTLCAVAVGGPALHLGQPLEESEDLAPPAA